MHRGLIVRTAAILLICALPATASAHTVPHTLLQSRQERVTTESLSAAFAVSGVMFTSGVMLMIGSTLALRRARR